MTGNKKIVLGDLTVKVGGRSIVLLGRNSGPSHVTVHYAPQETGKHAGKWTPHVTLAGGRRFTLARVLPSTMERAAAAIGERLVRTWLAASRRVDLARLTQAGWRVHAPDTARVAHAWETACTRGHGQYVVDDAAIAAVEKCLADHFADDLVQPLDLLDRRDDGRPYLAFRARRGGLIQRVWLTWRPDGPLGPASWWATRFDWLAPPRLDEIMSEVCGPKLEDALTKVARALSLPVLAKAASTE